MATASEALDGDNRGNWVLWMQPFCGTKEFAPEAERDAEKNTGSKQQPLQLLRLLSA